MQSYTRAPKGVSVTPPPPGTLWELSHEVGSESNVQFPQGLPRSALFSTMSF